MKKSKLHLFHGFLLTNEQYNEIILNENMSISAINGNTQE